jgi:hypothetical protein
VRNQVTTMDDNDQLDCLRRSLQGFDDAVRPPGRVPAPLAKAVDPAVGI